MESKIKKQDQFDEYDIALKALEELGRYGETHIVCPRCGGKFIFRDAGSGAEVWCENNCGLRVGVRGI